MRSHLVVFLLRLSPLRSQCSQLKSQDAQLNTTRDILGLKSLFLVPLESTFKGVSCILSVNPVSTPLIHSTELLLLILLVNEGPVMLSVHHEAWACGLLYFSDSVILAGAWPSRYKLRCCGALVCLSLTRSQKPPRRRAGLQGEGRQSRGRTLQLVRATSMFLNSALRPRGPLSFQ